MSTTVLQHARRSGGADRAPAHRLPAWFAALLLAVTTVAAGSLGAAPARAASAEPGTFTSLSPVRLLDTRDGTGLSAAAAVPGGGAVTFQVTGRGGVPASDVGAATLNVTVTRTSAAGHVTAHPAGTAAPVASNLNFVAGQTIAGAVTVKLSADGKVTLRNGSSAPVHLLADVAGWYAAGTPATPGALTPLAPARVLDTRDTVAVPAGGEVDVQVTGAGGVPGSGVAAVVLTVTVTRTSAGGHVTAYPTGSQVPLASNLNFIAGQTIANAVTVRLGEGGKVTLVNGSSRPVHLLADVAGWFSAGTPEADGAFTSTAPARLLDTRSGTAVAAGGSVDVQVGGAAGIPAGAGAAVLNVTATRGAKAGHVTAHPAGTPTPNASSLNFAAGQTIPNQVTVRLSGDGRVTLTNGSSAPVHLVVDVGGWYAPAAPTPQVTYRIASSSPDGVVVAVQGTGFDPRTNPGDDGVYAGVAVAGQMPDTSDRDNNAFVGVNWAPASTFVNGSFTTSFVVDPEKLDRTKSYSIYTWQAHRHSNTTQDTETPIVIDWSTLD